MPEAFDQVSPEVALLVTCARTQLDGVHAERLSALLQGPLDWDGVLALATQQGVLPLLYWHLSRSAPALVPAHHLAHLRETYEQNTRRNLWLTGELIKLVNACREGGVQVVTYKGPVLAADVYGSLALRTFVDLDLLALPRDVPRLQTVLDALGYQPFMHLSPAQRKLARQYDNEYKVYAPERNYVAEFHWDFVPRLFHVGFDLEAMFSRTQSVSLAGAQLLTLAPADLLLTLFVHGAKHGWTRLGWLCDVAELIHVHQGLNWDSLLAQARTLGIERIVHLGLNLVADKLDVGLPREIGVRLEQDRVAKQLSNKLWHELIFEPLLSSERPLGLPLYLQARERLSDRLTLLLRWVYTPRPYDLEQWVSLPGFLDWLYPLYGIAHFATHYLLNPRYLKRLRR